MERVRDNPPWKVLPESDMSVGELLSYHKAFVVKLGDADPQSPREAFHPVRPTPPATGGTC